MSVHGTVGEGAVNEEMLAGPPGSAGIISKAKTVVGIPPTVQTCV